MNKNNHTGIRTWIEVDTKALRNNYNIFRSLIDRKCKLMAICKSNAYGHSLIDYSKYMQKLGADFIGVDSITEALTLRKEGINIPILVLGYTLPEMYEEAAEENISLTVSNVESLKKIQEILPTSLASYEGHGRFTQNDKDSTQNDKEGAMQGTVLKIHLKIDTGMHRQGFFVEELLQLTKELKKIKKVEVEGIYTHFAAAKNPAFPSNTIKQIEEFKKACEIMEKAGYDKIIRHAAATSGAIVFKESHFDMVRIGIGMMGLWPSKEVKACFAENLKLQPALTWKTIICEIKEVKKGEGVGYDFTEKFLEDKKIAILPIGYWHGYRRDLSSIGHVLINNQPAKILGRVSMDMIVVDITKINSAKVGDEVILLDSSDTITSAENIADLLSGSWYELITQINPLIKRIYITTDYELDR